jgi:hypothetical protein
LKTGILTALRFVELHQEVTQFEAEHARHDQRRRRHRNPCGILYRRQISQNAAHGLGMALREIPGDVGDRPQHRVEHDGAWHISGAKCPADGAVLVGEKEQCIAADRGQFPDVAGRPGEDAARDEVVFLEHIGLAYQSGQFGLCARISRRAEKAQHHPAPGADMQVERSAGDPAR